MVTRWVIVIALIVTAVACSDAAPETRISATPTTPPVATTTAAPTTSRSVTATTTTYPSAPGADVVVATASRFLVSGAAGISAVGPGGEATRLSDAPAALAFAVGDELIISQGFSGYGSSPLVGDGPIYSTTTTGTDSVEPRDGERLRLFDVGRFDGRVVAVATVTRGYGQQDTEERLILIDGETLRRTDLGVVGGWEYRVEQAQLTADAVVVILNAGAGQRIESRGAEREVFWRFDLGIHDEWVTLAASPDEVLILTPRFGDDLIPRLDVASYDPGTGALDATYSVELHASFDGGFCQSADWDGVRLICSESYGGPFSVDLRTGDVVRLSGQIDTGRPTNTAVAEADLQASQSPEDAARDGVVAEVAALPRSLRIKRYPEYFGPTRIETTEGTWMISRMDVAIPGVEDCVLGDPAGVYGRDYVCSYDYAELVLFDRATGDIVRAYPLPGMNPQALLVTSDAVYCSRQGDGAYPDSMLCRIDRATLDPYVRVFPSDFDSAFGDDRYVPDYWAIDAPVDYVLWSELALVDGDITITGYSGSAQVDPDTLELEDIVWTP